MSSDGPLSVRFATSLSKDPDEAVKQLNEGIVQEDMEAVIFFCTSDYDLAALGDRIKKTFPCKTIGCTSAGEISPSGYQKGGIVAVSLSSPRLKLHPRLIHPLSQFGPVEAEVFAGSLKEGLAFSVDFNRTKMFGLLLVDGMSILEERLIALLSNKLEGMSMTGGSAGDDMKFKETSVYWDGAFYSDAALFTLFETTLSFHLFQTQHFRSTDKRMVITEADPVRRVVSEIDAEPAARVYADLVGMPIETLSQQVFSKHPLMLKIGNDWYVRSIQRVNEDESLSFFCAIDRGLVLTLGESADMVGNLKSALEGICDRVPHPGLILGCDCILRRLEAAASGLTAPLQACLAPHPFLGFSTYGEQIHSIHVNHTLTGVVIGQEI